MARFNLFSKHPDNRWTQIICLMVIVFVAVLLYKRVYNPNKYEGFEQNQRYVVKRDDQVYDDFYATLYDNIVKPEKRADFEMTQIINWTQPSKDHSIFLDVGCGTSHLTHKLQSRGYAVQGLDKSQAMIDNALEKYPGLSLTCGDATIPMTFDKGSFTHILCTYMTIYQFKDKVEFFRNCYYWLRMSGYLIIHLVDKDKFDPIMPAGQSMLMESPQQYSETRITNTHIDFVDFKYRASYDFSKAQGSASTNGWNTIMGGSNANNQVLFREKMTDTVTNNVRENEQTLYMDSLPEILSIAQYCGFILQGQVSMNEGGSGDKHQYLVVFERPM